MKNIEHLCRICVRESQFFKHIFSQSLPDDSIFKIINVLCDLSIHEGDGLPQHICGECYGKLLEVQKFKKMCHDGSTALLSLKTKYSKVKREDVILQKDPSKVEKSGRPRSWWNKASVEHFVGVEQERMAPRDLEKQIAMNEVFIKTEPVDEVEEILPTGADDGEEVIIPEARRNATRGSVPYREAQQASNGMQRNPLEPDATDEETDRGNQPNTLSLKESGGHGMFKVRSPQFLMKSGPVAVSQGQMGNKLPMAVKQKALLLTDPVGKGNLVLHKMGPNKFLPLMLTKQSLILLQSPGNPGYLQAAYVKPTDIVPNSLQQQRTGRPPLLGGPLFPGPLSGGGGDGGRMGEEEDGPPVLVDRDMGVSYLCKTVSSNQRPHVCETCGKCFRRSLHLRYHCSTHRDERPFSCPECGKSFKLKTILTTHMMTHSREPPRFGCDLCEKKFPTRARLKYHQVVHSSERNFECRECGKRYKTKNQLGVHLRTHLRREPAYPCPTCGQRFKQHVGLQKHRARLSH